MNSIDTFFITAILVAIVVITFLCHIGYIWELLKVKKEPCCIDVLRKCGGEFTNDYWHHEGHFCNASVYFKDRRCFVVANHKVALDIHSYKLKIKYSNIHKDFISEAEKKDIALQNFKENICSKEYKKLKIKSRNYVDQGII